ncbi:MAG TPA: multicopper oxidase domain-containing protein [Bryobacteraceae bacterium]|nr:multicopper oxidase domain-containing protein [Bryobacteraceae bacterium]
MYRRDLLKAAGLAALSRSISWAAEPSKADFTLRIGRVSVELAPKKTIKTIGYNGGAPGPLLRMREGKPVSVDVYNDTGDPEVVHWHGLFLPSDTDGSEEEGTPVVEPHGHRRYTFTPAPSGTRWYHTHTTAKRDLSRALYTGQFGFLYIEAASEPGDYDQEVFLALKEWDPYFSGGDEGIEVAYKAFSINGHSLGHGEPVRVREGQRVMLRILNASATIYRRIGLSGHFFEVRALDGNPVARPAKAQALELGPAERIDAVVEMSRPGIWILGAADDHSREKGMGIVVEYAGQAGKPKWIAPPKAEHWDYTVFGTAPAADPPGERRVLTFEKKFAGSRWVDYWTINGKMYPKTDPILVKPNQRYRLVFDNRSDEAHPVHLHRHTFELVKVAGAPTGGVFKDTVVVPAKGQVEVDLLANRPGKTLFHCHNQMHMDYGFMTMMEYA